jgi:hypothetical protein
MPAMAVWSEDALDELERYLAGSAILDVAHFERHGAHRSFRLILEGGVGALAKPAHTIGEGEIVPRREAAAWVIARELGWPDLLAATVLRSERFPDSEGPVVTSVQVLWPDVEPDLDIARFSEEDMWRAAVFDAVIGHTDRSGHNWLGVPGSSSEPRLKLVDHGYGFPGEVTPPSSTFFQRFKGQELPDFAVEALYRLRDRRRVYVLRDLLPAGTLEAAYDRAEAVASRSVLEIEPA